MFRGVRLLVIGLGIAAFASSAAAQTLYGSLLGNVTDSSAASVPGAKVVVVNSETGFTRETATNERGAYLFSDLPAGTYDVKISAPAFANFTKTGVALSVNTVVRVDVELQLAGVAETVTVAAAAAALQTDRSEVRA